MTIDECAKRMLDHFTPAIERRGLPPLEGIKAADAVLADLRALVYAESERGVRFMRQAGTGDDPASINEIADEILRTSPGKAGA